MLKFCTVLLRQRRYIPTVLGSWTQARGAGHSKWSTIKHAKGDADAKKAIISTKVAREVTSAVKAAGPDPTTNLRLAYALDKARLYNVSKDVVENCIRRAVDGKEGAVMETVIYEGTGPGGTAFLVECLTDKRTRTAPAMRHVFSKFGGDLGVAGSVAWQFETLGCVTLSKPGGAGAAFDEDLVLATALDAGASDVEFHGEVAEVFCAPATTHAVKAALVAAGLHLKSTEITRMAKAKVEVAGSDEAVFSRLLDELEENEDVQNVYHNAA